MFRASLVPLAVVAVLLLPAWAVSDDDDDSRRSRVKRVKVINFPNPQQVVGAVEVTNLPPVQDVNVVNPPVAPPSACGGQVFLGFTSATLQGDAGVFTFHGACAAEFTNARMCGSEELLATPTTPTGLVGSAWVLPSLKPLGQTVTDASGIQSFPLRLTCVGWKRANEEGLTVDAAGHFDLGECSIARSIACCGPQ